MPDEEKVERAVFLADQAFLLLRPYLAAKGFCGGDLETSIAKECDYLQLTCFKKGELRGAIDELEKFGLVVSPSAGQLRIALPFNAKDLDQFHHALTLLKKALAEEPPKPTIEAGAFDREKIKSAPENEKF